MDTEIRDDSDVELNGRPIEELEAEMQAHSLEEEGQVADPVQMAAGLLYASYEQLTALRTAEEMPEEMKRAVAIAATKTEEALLWFGRFQALGQMFAEQASAEGNASNGGSTSETPSGLTVVEKPELIVVGDPGGNVKLGDATAGEPAGKE